MNTMKLEFVSRLENEQSYYRYPMMRNSYI